MYETGLPYFDVNPPSYYGSPPRYPGERGSKIINGYPVVVTNVTKAQLCAPRARGLIVIISEFGAQPAISVNSIFRHHLRLLGPNPANWTSNPIGSSPAPVVRIRPHRGSDGRRRQCREARSEPHGKWPPWPWRAWRREYRGYRSRWRPLSPRR